MPCRSCPSMLDKAIHTIDEIRRDLPQLLPPAYDYAHVQAALAALKDAVTAELVRQGRRA